MRLTIDKLYGEIVVLMTYCATGNVEYLSSTECANRFKNILETIKEYKIVEKEFGIDLITLFKALINEYIFIKQDNEIYENNVEFSFNKDEKGWYINLEVCHFDKLYFKDYGKTWALTKEELL